MTETGRALVSSNFCMNMIRNAFKKTGRLQNCVKVPMMCMGSHMLSVLVGGRTNTKFITLQKLSVREKSEVVYNKGLYDYFKTLQPVISVQKSSWPPMLLRFLGENARTAMENFNAIVCNIHLLEKSMECLSEVDELILETTSGISTEENDDLLTIAEDERRGIIANITDTNQMIVNSLMSLSFHDQHLTNEVALEVSAGVGGLEAMLFAAEVFSMYQALCANYGQNFQVITLDQSEAGGYQKASAHILFSSVEFSRMFLNESGIHRVQRVPSTDRYGRIHTSTVSVAVLPVFDKKEIDIPEKDLEITPVRKMNSPGGQHANKTSSAIRIKHKPTGTVVESSSSRLQLVNRQLALTLLNARLSQQKFTQQEDLISKTRHQQIKNNERSDKIRTYNFHKDRITDHRIGFSLSNVSQVMEGGALLYGIMEKLAQKFDADEFEILVESLLEEGKIFLNNREKT